MSIDYRQARKRMVHEQLERRGIRDPRLLDAFRRAPRDAFLDPALAAEAYRDRALPIPCGQTISQPYMVGIMTQYLAPLASDRVLEVGTGSGYQAAILSALARTVYTVERHSTLSARAQKVHAGMGITNIAYRVGDGSLGWPEYAPFDGILVTAGAPQVPQALRGQLAEGGRMVVPTGSRSGQMLTIIARRGDAFEERTAVPCIFVPLVGDEGWEHD